MNYSGIRILTISPGAWPCAATPLHRRLRWWSSMEEGFSPSWTLRPLDMWRPSFSSPLKGGMAFFFLLLFLVVLSGGGMSLGIFDVMFEAPL